MVPLFCFMILPFLNGDWTSSNLTWGALDGTAGSGEEATSLSTWEVVRLSIVWLWIMAWSSWGVDTCATFAPEYKDTVNDTRLALRSACIFTFVVFILLPLGLVGGVGEETVAAFDYVGALEQLTGSESLTNFFVVVIVGSFLISMNTATADGGRALYGIARDHMTIKQLYHLNRHHVPGRAMTIDMVLNICFVFLIGNIFGVLAASNIGYVLAHFFAITGFILLRRDRPELAAPDPPGRDLGADRLRARRDRRGAHGDRRRLVPDVRRRLRRHEGEGHRLLRARDLDPALLLPAARPGQAARPAARGRERRARRARAGADRRDDEGRDLSRACRSGTRAPGPGPTGLGSRPSALPLDLYGA